MVSSKVVVRNPKGLHLKPAGYLCNIALEYTARITLRIRNKEVNGKSVLGVLSACIKTGEEVEVICDGVDEEKALEEITKQIDMGLGEEINS